MFDLQNKTDAEWRQKLEECKEQCTDKLAQLQKVLDAETYENKTLKADNVRLEYLLTYVLDYFLNERKIKISDRDMDLFYLRDIVDTYHEEKS